GVGVGPRSVAYRDYPHAERARDPSRRSTDAAETEDTEGLAMELFGLERRVAPARLERRVLPHALRERKQMREDVFGDRLRVQTRSVRDANAALEQRGEDWMFDAGRRGLNPR